MNPFKLIAEELPKFLTEMNVPFLGKDEPQSVMAPPSAAQQEKQSLENILSLSLLAAPAGRLASSALQLAAKAPRTTAVGTAALTQDPSAVFLGPAGALSTYSPEAQSAIRPGGRPDINMTHNLGGTYEKLMELLTGRQSLSSPSIAISRNTAFPFAESPTLIFNPASPLLDPRAHRANQLYNRDAWVDTGKLPNQTRAERLGQDTRLSQDVPGYSQSAAIMASPRFRSFAEYEGSKAGARTLSKNLPGDREDIPELGEELAAYLRTQGIEGHALYDPIKTVNYLQSTARLGDETAQKLLEQLRTLPSEYAELKVAGEVPLNAKNVSAVVVPSYWRPEGSESVGAFVERIKEVMPGVPVGRPVDIASDATKRMWKLFSEQAANRINTSRQSAAYIDDYVDYTNTLQLEAQKMPYFMRRYFSPEDLTDMMLFSESISPEQIYRNVLRSNAASADVATQVTRSK